MTNKGVLHENENYQVVVNDQADGYYVVNRQTDIIESKPDSLPQAIAEAEQANSYIVHSLWKWIRKQSESDAEQAGITDDLDTVLAELDDGKKPH